MKVAIYIRVSTEDQAERGTIENQIEFATKYCDLHQLEIVDWYKDDGISGTVPLELREEGKRMLEDSKEKKFDLLLVYKLDRLGRSARIILNAVHELESYGIKIKSMTEPFDTSDPSGRFLLTILAGVADLERSTILERLWYGANRAAREGKWVGGIVPYGFFVNDEGYLEINEEPLPGCDLSEADVVRKIFYLTTERNYTTGQIADHLNALGVPPSYAKDNRKVSVAGKRKEKTAGIWRASRIGAMLKNETYRGIHRYGKRSKKTREVITREVPAIISEEQWEKAQRVLKSHQIETKNNTRLLNLLKGLVICGECGKKYYLQYFNNSRRPDSQPTYYYICIGKTKEYVRANKRCCSKNVPREWLEQVVWQDILSFAQHPGNVLKEIKPNTEQQRTNHEEMKKERSQIERAILEKGKEKQSILDLFRKKFIFATDVEIQLQKIDDETKVLQEELNRLNLMIENEKYIESQLQNAETVLRELKEKVCEELDFEAKFKIIHSLVKEITVHTIKNPKGRDKANISIKYLFTKGNNHTDKQRNS
ncbi:recombinase family protein [Aneurinibacillus thermoaerophilus]|uniref:recombinase family protein n=1 Tax=Aneurinibacillus thermoaerophilus TaxID=143495 RepID=UPI002E21DDCF|nr:recombinase family protein [Aneurinibacillus thermoaerophilus]MED0765272.1 recombinase family protein [Aneurinibacillus thermoaerophilus]